MDLFIQPEAHLVEKTASEVSLPEDANAWPNEIMQELYKQVPYIADYEPNVVMSRVDAERGYGLGHVEVMNKTELPQGASPEAMKSVGVQQVRVPIIVKDRKLQPFDLLITGDSKTLPLNESRLRQSLFRPQAFDVTGRTPGDMSMVGQLYPPYRQNYGFGGGGGGGMAGGMGKEGEKTASARPPVSYRQQLWGKATGASALEDFLNGSATEKTAAAQVPNSNMPEATGPKVRDIVPKFKTGSILSAILPTINTSDYVAFLEKISHPTMRSALAKNAAAMFDPVKKLMDYEPAGAEKTAAALAGLMAPSVVQVVKIDQGYLVKSASHLAWAPREAVVDRGELVEGFGGKVALAADTTGSVTISDEGVSGSPEENRADVANSFGVYKVQSTDGAELKGFIFPNLYDVDGTALPIALFTDGNSAALQAQIVGELQTGPDVPQMQFSEPSGHGCFVRLLEGSAEATVPLTIQGSYQDPGGKKFRAETFDGNSVFVALQPNIQKMTVVEDTVLLPESWQWLPLGDAADVSLVSHKEEWGAPKLAARKFASITIRAGGDNQFSLTGVPLSKFAAADCSFLSLNDTLFMLAGFGTDLRYASEKLAEAVAFGAPVDVRVGRGITLEHDARQESLQKAASKLAQLPVLKRDLLKESAFIPDPLAVDTVLSLGFINPENLMTFVSYLPQLDQTQSRLCELLMAGRLGASDIPTGPLEKAIRYIEEVIDGLKVIAFQKV